MVFHDRLKHFEIGNVLHFIKKLKQIAFTYFVVVKTLYASL